MKCPGQDTRYWKPGDIYEVSCPVCGKKVEFFKDDPWRRCPHCNWKFRNPQLNVGCAEWCPFAKDCLGVDGVPVPRRQTPAKGPEKAEENTGAEEKSRHAEPRRDPISDG